MSLLATETFTATNGTLITARPCDTGQNWTKASASDAANIVIQSNQAQLSGLCATAFSKYVLGVSLGNADYTILGTLKPVAGASDAYAALYLRTSAGSPSGYLIRRDAGGYAWHIERNVGGTETTLVTTTSVPSDITHPINVTFTVSGVGATVSLSATIAIPAITFSETINFSDTDATRIVATGLPGIGIGEFTTTPRYAWDDLEVDGTAGGGTILKGLYYAMTQGLL